MAGNFLGRLVNLVKGAASNLLRDLERDNPEAVLQAAIEAQQVRSRHLQSLVGHLNREERRLKTERVRMEQDVASLEKRAAEILPNDEAEALRLLQKKQLRLDRVEELDLALKENKEQREDAQAKDREARAEVKDLRREKQELAAELREAKSRDAQAELNEGISTSAADAALGRLREGMDRLAETNKTREIARANALKKAEAELELLKKSRRANVVQPSRPLNAEESQNETGTPAADDSSKRQILDLEGKRTLDAEEDRSSAHEENVLEPENTLNLPKRTL